MSYYIRNSHLNLVPTWFDIDGSIQNIYLYILTNEKLDNLEFNFSDDKIFYLYGYNPSLDIDKLIDKLDNIKSIFFDLSCGKLTLSRLPSMLKEYISHYQHDILEYPKTLELYKTFDILNPIIIPNNLPSDKDIEIIVTGKHLTESFYLLSSCITNLNITVNTLGLEICMWPINLKVLSLHICSRDNTSYGILPYGLITFILRVKTYKHILNLPSSITNFTFISMDKYITGLNDLPNNIEYLETDFYTCPDITILPIQCKIFKYGYCPYNKILQLKKKYNQINISY